MRSDVRSELRLGMSKCKVGVMNECEVGGRSMNLGVSGGLRSSVRSRYKVSVSSVMWV